MSTRLWVVVPAYNEAARISATLYALAAQTDTAFTLLVVDNGSTDTTADAVRSFMECAPFAVQVLTEREKGVGCAVDTGFRHAIASGAELIVRTDADCIPRPGWVAAARAALDGGAGMVCGRITARRDEHGPAGRAFFAGLVTLAALFGRLRPAHHGGEYLAPYRMHAGNNMAITARLYEACGGMPRRPSPTDRLFLNRVRRTTASIVHSRTMVVENSTRRIKAYGVMATAKWYLDRGSGPLTPDPR
ncbi:glycosyltransferase involved in cell wall biosynthesis [Actinoplanes lutulentus]|uniref:4,4'-diaponeurosporenoate glycosyltransferase n=1 Tax=Actinoplanes lutulentus TaxID=1287878 RepID=A0A327ZAZ0_9ACTN|nr:glycosyltransferase family 2 protein [Actinoplanes lutulentus]MBB2941365.1 glycosyltransferase involved in cell wall biosynthesis [Actinoplanes lutulentus]RAK36857.1 glycosyltransferase involved in cell wall biosynthesis [Actinoplanes lutulentus]